MSLLAENMKKTRMTIQLHLGDCLEKMKEMPNNSVDSIVCDPPYGLSFMGKKWDYDVPKVEIWQECLRVLKPGGHLLAFAGTRTQHRMVVNIEDAGFEIRDMIAWVYGSGFPKSHNIGKAVDKIQGNEREIVGNKIYADGKTRPSVYSTENSNEGWKRPSHKNYSGIRKETKGNSEWEGWGTALKPALEPITVARKPISEKNIAKNVLKWGTGGINIDESRVGMPKDAEGTTAINRFPANFIHDGSQMVLDLFPETGKSKASKRGADRNGSVYGTYGLHDTIRGHDDNGGSAARFFYCAKASKREKNAGLEEGTTNGHPTVKPVKLMTYLVRLATPKNGVCLDPFMGSGTTGVACKNLNRNFIGIELDEEYFDIAQGRIDAT